MEINKKQAELIYELIDILHYKLWDSEIGDHKAQCNIDRFHKKDKGSGIMAQAFDLQRNISEKLRAVL